MLTCNFCLHTALLPQSWGRCLSLGLGLEGNCLSFGLKPWCLGLGVYCLGNNTV